MFVGGVVGDKVTLRRLRLPATGTAGEAPHVSMCVSWSCPWQHRRAGQQREHGRTKTVSTATRDRFQVLLEHLQLTRLRATDGQPLVRSARLKSQVEPTPCHGSWYWTGAAPGLEAAFPAACCGWIRLWLSPTFECLWVSARQGNRYPVVSVAGEAAEEACRGLTASGGGLADPAQGRIPALRENLPERWVVNVLVPQIEPGVVPL